MLLFAPASVGQSSYYVRDTTKREGVILIASRDRDNARHIRLKAGEAFIVMRPDEIEEYGLANGRVYESHNIQLKGQNQRVFLERLTVGGHRLLYFKERKKHFFLSTSDQPAVYLDRSDYGQLLFNILEAKPSNKPVEPIQTRYSKQFLTRYVNAINEGQSRQPAILRYGIYIGLLATRLIVPLPEDSQFLGTRNSRFPLLEEADFQIANSLYVEGFANFPLGSGGFGFSSGLGFGRATFTSSHTKTVRLSDFSEVVSAIEATVELSSFQLPMLLRYEKTDWVVKPFVEFGGLLKMNVKNEYEIEELRPDALSARLYTQDTDGNLLAFDQWGYSVGGGCYYPLSPRRLISIKASYVDYFNESDRLDQRQFSILLGITL